MTRPAYLVSHTHWDREWYRTFQQFRLDLVKTIDGVLDVLEGDPAFAHFLLDGQTIVLDDYLTMRPGAAPRLARQIASGRLAVGPWYCHPDFFLVSGESIVRNLMLGLRVARSYGAASMVGYSPDQFGHTGQLPQIYAGFGIESAVLWRGVDARTTQNESWWEAPDGSRVLLVLLARSYGNAQHLPLDPPALALRLRQLSDALVSGATGPAVLLMNGNDHLPVQAGLPAALASAAPALSDDWSVGHTSLAAAIDHLRHDGTPRGVVRGDLRSSATAHLLPGVLSARTYLKRRNAQVQQLLERVAEPWSALAVLLNPRPYPAGELWEAWRLLLQNQPHDSICGCSIDAVHREMAPRYDGAEQIGDLLAQSALTAIAGQVRGVAPLPGRATPIVVFNGGDRARTERVDLEIELTDVATRYRLVDARGWDVPHRWGEGVPGESPTTMSMDRADIPSTAALLAQFDGNRLMGMGLQRVHADETATSFDVTVTVGDVDIMSREQVEEQIAYTAALLAATAPLPVSLTIARGQKRRLTLRARAVPGHGYTTYWLMAPDDEPATAALAQDGSLTPDESTTPTTREAAPRSVSASADPDNADLGDEREQETTASTPAEATRIETDWLRVDLDGRTGGFMLTDKRSGTQYGPCNTFVDGGDAGDSYNYAPPRRDKAVTRLSSPPRVDITEDALGVVMRVETALNVPHRLSDERDSRSRELVPLVITSSIALTQGSDRVDIQTTVENTAEDHRLKVAFSTPFPSARILAEGAYDVVDRPYDQPVPDDAAQLLEAPVPEAPQQGFVLIQDSTSTRGLAVTNLGLPEYRATARDGTTSVEITLLRCIGWLSRDDLATRNGSAGPSLPVPEAQCLGRQTFSYGLIPYDGPWPDVVAAARDAHLPLHAVAIGDRVAGQTPTLPFETSLLSVDASALQIAALKGAEDGAGAVVRVYNPTDEVIATTMRAAVPLSRVETLTLDERPIDIIHAGAGVSEIAVRIKPRAIQTLRLVAAPRDAL